MIATQQPLLDDGRSAVFSEDRKFRYHLGRLGKRGGWRLCWTMLNPSKAGAHEDDPTVRKVMGFSERFGGGPVSVVNMYDLVETDPNAMMKYPLEDRLGPEHEKWIQYEYALVDRIIFAWGGHKAVSPLRVEWHIQQAALVGKKPLCLGYTKDGQPRHPLMLSYKVPFEDYERRHRSP